MTTRSTWTVICALPLVVVALVLTLPPPSNDTRGAPSPVPAPVRRISPRHEIARPEAPPPDIDVDFARQSGGDRDGGRAPAPLDVLSGRVLDEDGAPVDGAEISWTALVDRFCDLRVRLVHEGFEEVWSASPSTTSDAAGGFVFNGSPDGAEARRSVVWITHPLFEARPIVLEAGRSSWRWPADVKLSRARCHEVIVVDLLGTPVFGATVDEFLTLEPYRGDESFDREQKARKVFGRRCITGSDGRGCIPATPGMSVVMAFKNNLRAATRWIEREEKVTLVLRGTFRLEGRVEADLGAADLGAADPGAEDRFGANVAVAALAVDGSPEPTWLLPRISVRADGAFGPTDCPVLACQTIHVRLTDGPFLETAVDRPAPREGEVVQVTIDALVGAPFTVLVRDAAQAPIAGLVRDAARTPIAGNVRDAAQMPSANLVQDSAQVLIKDLVRDPARAPIEDHTRDPARAPVEGVHVGLLFEASSGDFLNGSLATTDVRGEAKLRAPRDHRFYLEAYKLGWASVSTDLFMGRADMQPIEIVLSKSGRVEGRCVHDGSPVTSFEVVYWRDDVNRAQWRRFQSAEGRFEIDDVARGSLTLFAVSESLPQSARTSIEVGTESGAEVVLELPESIALRSRVLDELHGAPVPSARVQLYSSHAGQVISPRGAWMPVNSDGSFELHGIGVEGGGYAVEADGYATGYGVVMPGAKSELSIGIVVLHPLSTLTVRIVGSDSADYSGYALATADGNRWPATNFLRDGEAQVDGLRPGAYELELSTPSGEILAQEVQIRSGSTPPVEFDVSRRATLSVRFDPPESRALAAGGVLRAFTLARDGCLSKRRLDITGSGPLRIEGLREGPIVLEASNGAGDVLCSKAVTVGASPGQEVALQLGGASVCLRVVDTRGNPLSVTRLEARTLDGAAPWRCRKVTDARGDVCLGPIAEKGILVNLQHATLGRSYGIPVDLARAGEGPIVLVLDAPHDIRLRVLDGETPREGVQIAIDHAAISTFERCFWTSGPGGLVECKGFADGGYCAVVNHAGYWPTRHAVRASASTEITTVRLTGLGRLRFRVKDEFGGTRPGLHVELESLVFDTPVDDWLRERRVRSVPDGLMTGTDGELSIEGLPEGSYTWRLLTPFGVESDGQCTVTASKETLIECKVR